MYKLCRRTNKTFLLWGKLRECRNKLLPFTIIQFLIMSQFVLVEMKNGDEKNIFIAIKKEPWIV